MTNKESIYLPPLIDEDFDIEEELKRIEDYLNGPPILSKDLVEIGKSILEGFIAGFDSNQTSEVANDE